VGLLETINDVLATAKKLKASTAANEANTKALMIEPLLGSLGWNPIDRTLWSARSRSLTAPSSTTH
jgi:hypothetical protein